MTENNQVPDDGRPVPPSHTQPYAPVTPQAQPQQNTYQTAPARTYYAPEPDTKRVGPSANAKTFLWGFLGAALAVVIVFLFMNVVFGNNGTSTTLGNSDGSTITVSGDDTATRSEVVSQKVLPSVVSVDAYTATSGSGYFGLSQSQSSDSYTESSLGSGVVISNDGYILTNYHVIEGSDKLTVTAQGETYDATIVGTDETSDLAVLKISGSFTAIEIGTSSDLVVGEWVLAAGSPYGLEQSVSTGIVSATSRTTSDLASSSSSALYVNMIQTDAAINPGNSGGALVDGDGKLIGINTLIASSSGTSSGVGFAIPVDYAIDIAQQIINGKTPTHAQLGVSGSTINSSIAARYGLSVNQGAYVSSVESGSGAEKAGLKQGDIITKLDDTAVTSVTDLILDIRAHDVGETVKITYSRDGQESTVDVTLGSDEGSTVTQSSSSSLSGGSGGSSSGSGSYGYSFGGSSMNLDNAA